MDNSRGRFRHWRAAARGVLGGAVAFGVVYAVTFALESGEATNASEFASGLAEFLGPDAGSALRGLASWLEPDPGQVVAWFVYASHRVPLELEGGALGQSVSRSVDVQALPVWNGTLAFVPPVALLLAGVAVAALGRAPGRSPVWLTGTGIALGYGVTALLALATATYSRGVGFAAVRVAPDPLVVGVNCTAYALAFGTAGAVIHAGYDRWKTSREQPGETDAGSEPVGDE